MYDNYRQHTACVLVPLLAAGARSLASLFTSPVKRVIGSKVDVGWIRLGPFFACLVWRIGELGSSPEGIFLVGLGLFDSSKLEKSIEPTSVHPCASRGRLRSSQRRATCSTGGGHAGW